jgi:hypothetical protein
MILMEEKSFRQADGQFCEHCYGERIHHGLESEIIEPENALAN